MKYFKATKKLSTIQSPGKKEQDTALPTLDEYLTSIDEQDNEPDVMIPYKCKKCGYEENVPEWLIDEMCGAKDLLEHPDNYDAMTCPQCNGVMKPKK